AEQIFAPRRIVEVAIEMKEDDWRALCAQNRNFVSALGGTGEDKPFSYFSADVTIDGKKISNVGVRKKGFLGSLDAVRPSLKIKFDEYQKQKVGVGFDRLTLNNNKQDSSRLTQYLSYKFFNDSGTVASRCNFARVSVNGKPLGIYSNVESVEEPMLAARFGDGSGPLYEGTTTDLFPGAVDRFEAKNKAAKEREINRLAEVLDRDELVLADVEQLLDLKAFVRFWATESLIGFWDGYTLNQNNYFVYRSPRTGKWLFLPWGLDSAFTESIPLPSLKSVNKSVYANSQLANRLYRIPEVQKMYVETMRELLKHWNEEELLADVEATATLLREDAQTKTPEFERRLREIRTFIRGRRATIERELERGVLTINHGARRTISVEKLGKATGSFKTKWNERTPATPTASGQTDLSVELNGAPVEFSKLGVTAEPGKDPNSREADGRMPPTVVFHGVRKSDQKSWMLAVGTTSESFRPSPKPATVGGIIIEGSPLLFLAKMIAGLLARARATATR
ncbi:MAG TPA: CotH kinase family protein, partial [Pirellulaceae bacterium]|nr:CotH kinase family protein [Pirellulaceae bacterium]